VSRIGTKFKGLLAVAALGATLAIAAPAGALTLVSASMDTANIANISGGIYGPGGVNAYDAPVTFVANDGAGDFSFTAFCVDIYHDMFLGTLNAPTGFQYHEEALVYDSSTSTSAQQNGILLTLTQLNKVKALVNYGAFLMASGASDLGHKLAAVQAGIWQVEYGPAYTVTVNAAVQAYLPSYIAAAGTAAMPSKAITTIFADDYAHQAFAFASDVPEPATWTMMIMGFGLMGATLRRRRTVSAAA